MGFAKEMAAANVRVHHWVLIANTKMAPPKAFINRNTDGSKRCLDTLSLEELNIDTNSR